MFRINSSGATVDNRFKESPPPATRVTADWLNAIQEEIAKVVVDPTGGDLELDAGNNGQLLAAILAMLARNTGVTLDAVNKRVTFAGGLRLQVVQGPQVGSGEPTHFLAWPVPFDHICLFAIAMTHIPAGNIRTDAAYQVIGLPDVNGCTVQRQYYGGGTDGATYPRVLGIGW